MRRNTYNPMSSNCLNEVSPVALSYLALSHITICLHQIQGSMNDYDYPIKFTIASLSAALAHFNCLHICEREPSYITV